MNTEKTKERKNGNLRMKKKKEGGNNVENR